MVRSEERGSSPSSLSVDQANRLARAAGASAIGGILIASLSLAPHPLGVVAGALVLWIPGWSVMTVLMPQGQKDRLAEAVTSILISVVVLIGICLLLDLVSIRIGTRSVGLSVLIFEMLVAGGLLLRSRRSAPGRDSSSGLESRPAGDPDERVGKYRSVGKTTVSWMIGLATIGAAAASVALVHRALPTPVAPGYASIAFADANGSAKKVVNVSSGPLVIPVHIGGNHVIAGSLKVTLDGSVISGPVPVHAHPPSILRLTAQIPALDGCRHQLAVELRPAGLTTLRVIRYVAGPVGTTCSI